MDIQDIHASGHSNGWRRCCIYAALYVVKYARDHEQAWTRLWGVKILKPNFSSCVGIIA